jgi:hypothetical protein
MNWKNGQAQGFALFTNPNAARSAIDAVTQLVFDDHTVLRAEIAHKNMYIKDDGKRRLSYPPAASGTAATIQPFMPGAVRGPLGYAPVSNTKDNPPCNTLFIGNLSDTCSEAELQSLFASQPVGSAASLLLPKLLLCPGGARELAELLQPLTPLAAAPHLRRASCR